MNLSDEGKRLIYSFEGLHKKTSDGKFAAYLCPAKVPTIYCGLTEGVKIGDVITEAEGEAMFAREIAKFEAGVSRLVTVDLNQNQFDALVSLSYNIGLGAFGKSTVLKKVNAKDWQAAAKAMNAWNKGGGRVLPGLVSRRAREASLFLKPTQAPDEPAMPQAVAVSREVTKPTVAVGAGVGGAGVVTALPSLPAPPDVGILNAWTAFGDQIGAVMAWGVKNPLISLGVAMWILGALVAPRFVRASQ